MSKMDSLGYTFLLQTVYGFINHFDVIDRTGSGNRCRPLPLHCLPRASYSDDLFGCCRLRCVTLTLQTARPSLPYIRLSVS